MSAWQPIETAPKDGTEIYVWAPGWNGRGPLVRTAWCGTQDGACGFWMNEFLNGSYGCPFKPAHWTPIPPPPVIHETARHNNQAPPKVDWA